MTFAVDTSILAYAVNRHVPEHHRATGLLERLVDGGDAWALPWPVLHEFLGLVTHPHAVVRPLSAEEALGFVEQVLSSPSARVLGPTAEHAGTLAEVIGMMDVREGLPAGIEIAVILREHGIRELLSCDPSMRRFPFLSISDPLHGEDWSPAAPPRRRYRVLGARRD